MILYHASTVEVQIPDLAHSREYLDFGKGFYLTSLREQAIKYADRFILRGQDAVLNTYQCNDSFDGLSVLRFQEYDESWLEFVGMCRTGKDDTSFDIVEGGIANDKIFRTVDLFFSGDITKDDALQRLKMEKPNHQICFRSKKAISLLVFKEGMKLK